MRWRYYILQFYPKISINNTYILKRTEPIYSLHNIDKKFYIRQLSISDAENLKTAYGNKNNFEKTILPRLNSSAWVPLAVINSENNCIAYISWVIKENTTFINEFNIRLESNQCFLRHGYCVSEYRHQGLHTRMEQERINYCISKGFNEIFIQIGSRNVKGIDSVLSNGYAFYKKNYVIYISGLGLYRELFSTLKNPFRRVI